MRIRIGFSTEKQDNHALLLMLTAGVMLGSCLCAVFPGWQLWQSGVFRQGMGTAYPQVGFGMLFLQLLVFSGIWVAFLALSGISLAGYPISLGIFFFRGAAIGSLLEEIYRQQGILGVITILAFVLPHALAGTWILMNAAHEGIVFSRWLRGLVQGCTLGDACSLRAFAVRYLLLAAAWTVLHALQTAGLVWAYPLYLEKMI